MCSPWCDLKDWHRQAFNQHWLNWWPSLPVSKLWLHTHCQPFQEAISDASTALPGQWAGNHQEQTLHTHPTNPAMAILPPTFQQSFENLLHASEGEKVLLRLGCLLASWHSTSWATPTFFFPYTRINQIILIISRYVHPIMQHSTKHDTKFPSPRIGEEETLKADGSCHLRQTHMDWRGGGRQAVTTCCLYDQVLLLLVRRYIRSQPETEMSGAEGLRLNSSHHHTGSGLWIRISIWGHKTIHSFVE
jgi:hypothetical protein